MKIVQTSSKGIADRIAELASYQDWLVTRAEVFLDRLAQRGLQVAQMGFKTAQYDGTNDVSVRIETGKQTRAIVAVGKAVLYIEFGTGKPENFPDNHPEKPNGVGGRGSQGQHKGLQDTWGYYGDPGTNGKVVMNKSGREVVLTHGNPANMPMYRTKKELEAEFTAIAREVFK